VNHFPIVSINGILFLAPHLTYKQYKHWPIPQIAGEVSLRIWVSKEAVFVDLESKKVRKNILRQNAAILSIENFSRSYGLLGGLLKSGRSDMTFFCSFFLYDRALCSAYC